MHIEWTLPNLDLSSHWRDRPYAERMVLIATMSRHWLKTL